MSERHCPLTLTDELSRAATCRRLAHALRRLGPCNTAGYVADLYPVIDLRDPVVPLEQIDEVFRG